MWNPEPNRGLKSANLISQQDWPYPCLLMCSGGRITKDGLVVLLEGRGAMSALSLYFLRSSEISPNSIAR